LYAKLGAKPMVEKVQGWLNRGEELRAILSLI